MLLRMTALAALPSEVRVGGGPAIGRTRKTRRIEAEARGSAKVKRRSAKWQDFIGLWNLEGTQKDRTKTIAGRKGDVGLELQGRPEHSSRSSAKQGKYSPPAC